MTTASSVLQELLAMVQDVKTNADYAKSDIEEKQTRLEDLHTEIEDGLNTVEDFASRLEELDDVQKVFTNFAIWLLGFVGAWNTP